MKSYWAHPFRLILWLAGCVSSTLPVQAITFTTDTTISATDTNYEGMEIVVTNCTLTMDGAHAVTSLQVLNGATLTHSKDSDGLMLTIDGEAFIETGGRINVNARGYSSGAGPGAGSSRGNPASGSGAGHGGFGGLGSSNTIEGVAYGSTFHPAFKGSGGGNGAGGSGGHGGGAIKLVVGSALRIDGGISANGANATNARAGGGSGGSVWLSAQTVSGTGSISANGGAGEPIHGGGGGGGRIAIYSETNSFAGSISSVGGAGFMTGGAGTIYSKTANQPVGQVLVDNGSQSGANTLLSVVGSIDLLLRDGAKMVALSPQTIRSLHVASNAWFIVTNQALTVSSTATIDSGGGILADGTGFSSGEGTGAGGTSSAGAFGVTGGGGGHGGFGAASAAGGNGGNSHGSLLEPTVLGSGGGRGNGNAPANAGGAGGGALWLTIPGTLLLNGVISANGMEGPAPHSGGGSGGSVWLTVGTLAGSGRIAADGGAGNGMGGGGGGGRIAVYYTSNIFSGIMTARGNDGGTIRGGAGTIYTKANNQSAGAVIVGNGGAAGANTTFGSYSTSTSDLRLKDGASLLWPSGSPFTIRNLFMDAGTLLIATNPVQVNITVSSNATILAGATILADSGGFAAGQGTGAGATANTTGGGGGYGGLGGTSVSGARGGSAYGLNLAGPVDRGSGGGFAGREFGGAGGGAIHLNVVGALQLDGRISVRGQDAPGLNAGGGSGGSLWLSAGRLAGSGSITANGGAGNNYGGGGGGGRIAVTYGTNLFSGVISAFGGPGGGGIWGGAGTIYRRANNSQLGSVLIDNGGHGGTTPLTAELSGDVTIAGRAIAVNTLATRSLNNLLIASNSLMLTTNVTAFTLTINSNATIQTGGMLSVDGAGFSSGSGTGGGRISTSTQFGTTGSGAGYGGTGANSAGGAIGGAAYGASLSQPTDRGSGGGAAPAGSGGAGGGAVRLNVARALLLDGTISANGRDATNFNSGGGSGGSVWVTAGTLAGSGKITANGGAGGNYGGGGGGGRIAIGYGTYSFNGSLAAYGGGGHAWGGAGTVYLKASNQPVAQVFVDNGSRAGTNTLFSESGPIDLTLQGGGVLSRSGTTQSFRNLIVGSNSWVLLTNQVVTATNVTVEAGGGIIADGAGYGPSQGPGAGRPSSSGTGSGGGHVGWGASSGTASGGNAYPDPFTMASPLPGSGGGNALGSLRGGAGGGVIRLTVTDMLRVDGRISAEGASGDWNGGGGSGGTVRLAVGGLSGSGVVSAKGGDGSGLGGGGGGGGRVVVNYGNRGNSYSKEFTGSFRAWGGASGTTNRAGFGGAGTIHLKANNQDVAEVLADNGGNSGTNTLLSDPDVDLTIRGGAAVIPYVSQSPRLRNLLVASNGWLIPDGLSVTLSGNGTIQAGGGILADRAGYPAGQGPGAGSNLWTSIYGYTGGGGGHGGLGAPSDSGAPSGRAYGVALFPFTGSGGFAGSGGGGNPTTSAGAGGGIIRLSAPAILLDGRISADGGDGINSHCGGGSGGSIALNVGVLSGSGVISAGGGDGNGVGGGGGGGRIAIACSTNQFAGATRAWGGLGGGGAGGAGTIYLKTNSLPVARLLVDNGGWPGVETPLENQSSVGLTVSGGATVQPSASYLAVNDLRVDAFGSVVSAPRPSNLDLIVYNNATIAAGGAISVEGRGFSQAGGPGAGLSADGFGSGAGHGGLGGASVTAPGGITYGSFTQPNERGSGGGFGFGPLYGGSEGGGSIRLNVGGMLTVNGRLSANGSDGLQDSSGGGSGGSLWVTTGAFAGDGEVTAYGGAGEWFGGGGGAGGRIAIYYRTSVPTNRFTGELSAFGGEGEHWGEDGTVFLSSGIEPLKVVSHSPAGVVSNAVSEIEIAFNLPVIAASFSGADYTLNTPSRTLFGTNLPFSVITPSRFQIVAGALTEPGDYTILLGPAVADLYGRPMSQVYAGTFTVALPAIEGTITDTNGLPVPGVLLGSSSQSPVVSDVNGRYRVGFAPGSSFTVAPAKSGLMFVPGWKSYTNMTTTLTNQNYLAVDTIAPPVTAAALGGEFVLGYYGYAGVSYQLFSSTNLVDWLPYGGTVTGSNALLQVPVPIEGKPLQFFRVRANY